ncbi:MAG TPA: OsmC family peroxiredoxin, partial [Armatimonadota bacterium]|nr:OsmC family peroxiredoxin [Armatimonadota bacterium]
MPTRKANAEWRGNLREGNGKISFSGFEGPYSVASRFEEGPGTNPEELIAAAHAGCFSMALAAVLAGAGYNPKRISTTAKVTVEKTGDEFTITWYSPLKTVWFDYTIPSELTTNLYYWWSYIDYTRATMQ